MKKAIVFTSLLSLVFSLNNGLGRTPQMGWNSWNHFGCNINENLIKSTADAIVSTGLLKAGYGFLNLDDCWASFRNSTGFIQPDPNDFPSGMKALADYVHSKGLKFGVYSDAGLHTCAGRPGSLGYEKQDAASYAEWGVDYLKYDNCYDNNTIPEVRYPRMRDALNATGRRIYFSMCEWGVDNPATWAPEVGNSWRTTGDIQDNWDSMTSRIDQNDEWYSYAAPGGWNDPDMLEVGNGGMSTNEYIAHFSLWALSKAPLLVGCDVTNIDITTLNILTAPEVIAVNQDPLGVQGNKIKSSNNLEVWAGPLADGSIAVVLFNRSGSSSPITVNWSDIKVTPTRRAIVRDLWARLNVGTFTQSYTANVASHGVAMVRVIPQ